ncbi:MAG TPA: sensor histidine kinase [Anaerolineales bacterium]|nr:sensor histidine kinase [Anaerolineales bacterium]
MDTWNRFRLFLYRIAASLTMMAVGVPGILLAFVNEMPNRWWVVVLTTILVGLNFAVHLWRWGYDPVKMRIYLAFATSLIALLLLLNPNLNFYIILFYVLATEALMTLPRREGYMWVGGFTAATVILLGLITNPLSAAISIPVYLGGFLAFVTFANATQEANRARAESQRLLEELQAAHRKLQEYAAQAEQLAVAEERNRLSREMHDTIGHRLTVASVQLEGVQKLIAKDPAKAEKMAETVREQVREALRELRQTVATLREPLEADLPLEVSLKKLARGFEEATNITIHLMLPVAFPEMSAAHRLALYRTAQEALTNAQKHAEAQQIWLQVARQEEILTLRISDNGKGLSAQGENSGFGLRGIQERAAQLGGELRLEERKGGGTQVCLSLPVTGTQVNS